MSRRNWTLGLPPYQESDTNTTRAFRNGYAGPDVPLLLTEKIAAGVFYSIQGIYTLLVHVTEDVKRLEMRARGLNPLRFGYTPTQLAGADVYASYWNIAMEKPNYKQA